MIWTFLILLLLNKGNYGQIIDDPTIPIGSKNVSKVLKISYSKGSSNSDCSTINTGVSFNVYPKGIVHHEVGTVEYDIYFPIDFNFLKGGILPGLIGGNKLLFLFNFLK